MAKLPCALMPIKVHRWNPAHYPVHNGCLACHDTSFNRKCKRQRDRQTDRQTQRERQRERERDRESEREADRQRQRRGDKIILYYTGIKT